MDVVLLCIELINVLIILWYYIIHSEQSSRAMILGGTYLCGVSYYSLYALYYAVELACPIILNVRLQWAGTL